MLKYQHLKKDERSHILEKVLKEMPPEQGRDVQDLAAGLVYGDPKRARQKIDYALALEIIMELGVNIGRMERDGLLSL